MEEPFRGLEDEKNKKDPEEKREKYEKG